MNSMSDLFHENVPDEWVDKIFAVMALSPQHTFQILTKRPERMLRYMQGYEEDGVFHEGIRDALIEGTAQSIYAKQHPDEASFVSEWLAVGLPLKNVWLGVSVEDQKAADERIPLLLQTPATVRFISAEPLLGPIDLTRVANTTGLAEGQDWINTLDGIAWVTHGEDYYDVCNVGSRLDWVICGGESGHGARPMDQEWAMDLARQCELNKTAFFMKQMGSVYGEHKGKDLPEDLNIKEYPA